jgi:O-acetyl-ADP-ribose deacetylase (regulator of RNase III)
MPEVIVTSGDIFASGCVALVSPVDAVTGAQGKGLALEFKRRWPERCAEYQEMCRRGLVEPGDAIVDNSAKPWILFAATKRHWRERSEVGHVKRCLKEIAFVVRSEWLSSIALQALGCGLGGLRWTDVRPLMLDDASRMQCDVVKIYEPR